MDQVYFSKAFAQAADTVWAAIRDFGEYRWGEGVGDAKIEGGGDSNRIGAVRVFLYYGQTSRQRLVAHSEEERSMAWESVEPFDDTLSHYRAALEIMSITATNGALVTWTSTFDARDDKVAYWHDLHFTEFGKSLDRLESLIKV